jgi:hypothetical protein
MSKRARVVGIHPVAADEPVHLVVMEIEDGSDSFDFGEVTQEVPGQPRSNWQVVWNEREIGENRFAFFFHHLDATKPLLCSKGSLPLPPESPLPEYLHTIEYERP